MVHSQIHLLKHFQIQVTRKPILSRWNDLINLVFDALNTDRHTHNSVHLCTHSKTPITKFTHPRSRAAPRNHDNGSSRSSPYWLKPSLIFSSVSRRSANDTFQLQPPHTAARASYQPPGESMRRQRTRRERLVAQDRDGVIAGLWVDGWPPLATEFLWAAAQGKWTSFTVGFYWPPTLTNALKWETFSLLKSQQWKRDKRILQE